MRSLNSLRMAQDAALAPRTRVFLLAAGLAWLIVYSTMQPATRADAATQTAIISGVIADAAGSPIPGAGVLARTAQDPTAYFARADDGGRFSIQREGLPGLVEVIAYSNGYGIGVKRYRLQAGEGLPQLLFLLERAGELRGRVVDRFSNPIAGARMQVAYSRPLSRLSTIDLGTNDLRTASDGTFRIRNLQPRVPFGVTADDPVTGRTSEESAPDVLAPGQQREDVVIVVVDRQ